MKYLLILFILTNLFSTQLLKKLDKLIKTKREKSVVVLDYDPFAMKEKKKIIKMKKPSITKKVEKIYKLSTIINNRAFINGKWYKKNDKIDSFIIRYIDYNSVVLSNKKRSITLKLENNNRILSIRNR